MIFVNLPVRDLTASTAFYEAIGCEKNPAFSDQNASCMVWSESIHFMLLTRDYFASFATRPVADARSATGVLLAISRDSRADVDAIAEAAAGAGGTVHEPKDLGFMYQRSFEDPDGHVFEAAFMDMAALAAMGEQAEA